MRGKWEEKLRSFRKMLNAGEGQARKPKVSQTDNGLGEGRQQEEVRKPVQVAPSAPKHAGNSCHSLSNVPLPCAAPSTPSIAVSYRGVNDKTLITPLINRVIFFFFFFPSIALCLMFVSRYCELLSCGLNG